ncbi:MAG TPA: competence/damage-inducible protein A [Gemmatimonadales bacterium]|jgi:nicotinamide-nucleotide amidase|nr:competence/damage-inducible protein A [Gemmatimonadales bacterium]
MDLELVTIGTELLLGFTVDTNGAEIAQALAAEGARIVRRTAVADRPDHIREAVESALGRTGAVLTTGGLGPTRDDMSKRVVAELLDLPLEFDDTVWADVLARYARFQRTPAASNRSQAEVPAGATVLRNRWGTAPGLWIEHPYAESPRGTGLVIMLPGVPFEMRMLLQHEVVPRLAGRSDGAVIRSLTLRTTGIPESTLAERMGEIEREIAPLTLAYLPGLDGVDLRLSAWQLGPEEAQQRLRSAAGIIRSRAEGVIYGEDDDDLAALVLDRARAKRLRLGTAESCTGGLVGGRLTEVPGSSDVFMGAVVCYHNDLKTSLLSVPPELIQAEGAVSEAVASAMATGALTRLGIDAAVAVTGIAGPGGGSESKPVGTIWLAVALGGVVETRKSVFGGSRHDIRARAAQGALSLLYKSLPH